MHRKAEQAIVVWFDVSVIFARGNPDKIAFPSERPAVIGASETCGLATAFCDRTGAMCAAVEECSRHPVLATHEQDRHACNIHRLEASGIGQLATCRQHQGQALENPFLLSGELRLVRILTGVQRCHLARMPHHARLLKVQHLLSVSIELLPRCRFHRRKFPSLSFLTRFDRVRKDPSILNVTLI